MKRRGFSEPDEDRIAEAARYLGPAVERLVQAVRRLAAAVIAFQRGVDELEREMRSEFADCKALLRWQIRAMLQVSDEELDCRLRDLNQPT